MIKAWSYLVSYCVSYSKASFSAAQFECATIVNQFAIESSLPDNWYIDQVPTEAVMALYFRPKSWLIVMIYSDARTYDSRFLTEAARNWYYFIEDSWERNSAERMSQTTFTGASKDCYELTLIDFSQQRMSIMHSQQFRALVDQKSEGLAFQISNLSEIIECRFSYLAIE